MAFREELTAGSVLLTPTPVANLPAVAIEGAIAYTPDGNAGAPGLVYFNGTQWTVVMTDIKASNV